MTFHRPNITQTDDNQKAIFADLKEMVVGWHQVADEKGKRYPAYAASLHGKDFVILDRSRAGGLTMDTTFVCGWVALDIEIKTPATRDKLTAGEKLYKELCPLTFRIATDADEYFAIMQDVILNRL